MGKKILRSLLIAFFITAISVILIGCSIALPTFDPSKLELEYKTSQIYDKNDQEIMSFQAQPGEHAALNEVPKWVSDGVVAVEDSRFYDHNGIDFRSIGRAVWRDILTGSAAEGGSTLTQQLAKNVYLTQDKTLSRKVKEVYLAAQIERNYSKEDILEMYLNRVYFGHGATGIKMAAEVYFDKGDHMKDLTLGECALLAGLPNAPSAYDPYVDQNIEAAIKRRNIVLDAMEKNGYITADEAEKAKQEKLVLSPGKNIKGAADNIKYPYYLDYILQEAEEKLDVPAEQILRGGVKVYTNLDPKFQDSLEKAYQDPKNFPSAASDGQIVQGASVIVDPKTGGISAIMGGRDQGDHALRGFNRASMAKVRPGSSFKPIVDYAPAIDTGFKTSTSLLNNKRDTHFGTYAPKNWKDYYTDTVPMTEAIQMSWNVPAASLLYEMGIDVGYKYATQNFGIPLDKEDENKLSIALGDVEISPLDLAGGYTAFVPDNGGKRVTPYAIRSIKSDAGAEIASIKTQQHDAIKPDTAKVMTKLMKLVVDSGTGTAAKISGRDVAGKTGTTEMEGTSGNRDAWFAGYTSDYVMVTWMGFDKSDQQHYLRQGSELPASMFAKVMSQGLAGTKSKGFDTNVQEKAPDDKDKTKDQPKEADTIVNDLAATFDGNKSVQVNWSPVKAEGVKYFLYRADKNPDGTAVNSIPLGQYSKPGYTDGSVVAGKSYWYSVVVWKDGQELSKSNFASVTIPGGKTEPPKDPNQPTQPGNGGTTQPGGNGTGNGGGTNSGGGTQQPGTPTNPNQPGTPDTGGGTQPPSGGGTTQSGNGTGNTQGTGGTTPPGSGGQPSIPIPPPTQ